ncbi:MAG: hypothetical protein HKP31_00935, partial [Nitrosopumilus sp.]|nr:hypothetical protein [Nitrosopumilus sp.]
VQDVISLDSFVKSSTGIEHTAGVSTGGTFEIDDKPKIPTYQKDVFGFWSDGLVSDDEIVNSIGHLMSKGIINSEKIKEKRQSIVNISNEYTQSDFPPLDEQTKKQVIQLESDILIANNLALEQFLEMQNFMQSTLDDSLEDAWNQYAKNKNKDYMNNAIELEQKLNDIKSNSKQTIQKIKDAQQTTDSFFDIAENNGFDIFILKTTSEQNLPILDTPSKIRTVTDLENAQEYVKKFNNFIESRINLSDSLIDSNLSESSTWLGIKHAWVPVIITDLSPENYDVDYLIEFDIEEESQIESINNDASTDATIPDDDITNDDFTIEANPMSLTLSNGEYGEILVKTKSLYGWESPVQITIPVIPSPMTYPPGYPHYVYPTPESETSSMIPVQISGHACTGEYILRIFGYGEHPAPDRILEVHEVRVAINTVREPSLELDSLEDSITIVQGGSHTFQLSFKSLDYASYSYIMGTVDPFTSPQGVTIETAPTLVWVDEQATAYGTVTVSTSESTPAPFTFELPIYAETGLDCYNPYREETSVTVNVVPLIEEETEMVQLIPVTALSIGDQQYPISQFTLWQWEGECDDQWHYHSPTGHAVALDGITGIPDPDQENCGFGMVSSFPNLTAWMSQSEIDNFKSQTGYDPLNSEAMMGGSGP